MELGEKFINWENLESGILKRKLSKMEFGSDYGTKNTICCQKVGKYKAKFVMPKKCPF